MTPPSTPRAQPGWIGWTAVESNPAHLAPTSYPVPGLPIRALCGRLIRVGRWCADLDTELDALPGGDPEHPAPMMCASCWADLLAGPGAGYGDHAA